jgi:hypothetical protein
VGGKMFEGSLIFVGWQDDNYSARDVQSISIYFSTVQSIFRWKRHENVD